MIDMLRRFVRPQKDCDKYAGEDLLERFESLPVNDSRAFGFSLPETAMILEIMVDHERKLNSIAESLETLAG